MRPFRFMWPAFAIAVMAVFTAMGWITMEVLRLNSAMTESLYRAQLEENVRLALWRMDSAVGPLMAAEHARPYAAFAEAPAPPNQGDAQSDAPAIGIEPPILPDTKDQAFAKVYFQFDAGGRMTYPSQPESSAIVRRFQSLSPLARLKSDLPARSEDDPIYLAQRNWANKANPFNSLSLSDFPNKPSFRGGNRGKSEQEQTFRNIEELQARAGNTSAQIEVQRDNTRQMVIMENPHAPIAGVMHPVWCGDELLLARRVPRGDGEIIQGCWLDWPAVQKWLLDRSVDLLPSARLEPLRPETMEPDARLLASLPARLVPGDLPAEPEEQTPLKISLAIAWGCVILACLAVGLLLRGVVSLSERRGAFVSAVTHELRTPLTTLRMYTEMLSEGMVPDESGRKRYLATLRAEADRLGHLVDNVLAYSRLERNRAGAEMISAPLAEILPRIIDRLTERVRQAGMQLETSIDPAAAAATVRVNPMSLEQILFNLIDNACKYASGSMSIMLVAETFDEGVALRVRDTGRGIPAEVARRLFRPFSKSVQEAANSAPGLGLGLALSQRLARAMGGYLKLEATGDTGTSFMLRLIRVDS